MVRFRDGEIPEDDPEDQWKHKSPEQQEEDWRKINESMKGGSILSLIIIFILIVLLGLSFSSCGGGSTNEPKEDSRKVGQHVYIDIKGCLHTQAGTTNRHKFEYDVVIDTVDLTAADVDGYCSMCVSKQEYFHLQKIMYRNSRK